MKTYLSGISFRTYQNADELFDAIETQQVDAVIYDSPILIHYSNTQETKVGVVGRVFKPEPYSLCWKQGDPFVEIVNTHVLMLAEAGVNDVLYDRYLKSAKASAVQEDEARPLLPLDFAGLYLCLGIFVAVGDYISMLTESACTNPMGVAIKV